MTGLIPITHCDHLRPGPSATGRLITREQRSRLVVQERG
jgi:hypothetical protein